MHREQRGEPVGKKNADALCYFSPQLDLDEEQPALSSFIQDQNQGNRD